MPTEADFARTVAEIIAVTGGRVIRLEMPRRICTSKCGGRSFLLNAGRPLTIPADTARYFVVYLYCASCQDLRYRGHVDFDARRGYEITSHSLFTGRGHMPDDVLHVIDAWLKARFDPPRSTSWERIMKDDDE